MAGSRRVPRFRVESPSLDPLIGMNAGIAASRAFLWCDVIRFLMRAGLSGVGKSRLAPEIAAADLAGLVRDLSPLRALDPGFVVSDLGWCPRSLVCHHACGG